MAYLRWGRLWMRTLGSESEWEKDGIEKQRNLGARRGVVCFFCCFVCFLLLSSFAHWLLSFLKAGHTTIDLDQ